MAAEISTTESIATEDSSLSRRAPSIDASAKRRSARRPLRAIAIFGAVGTLVTAIALPAFAGMPNLPTEAPATLQQLAAENAQSLVVASEATSAPMARGTFEATTPEEIEQKKAEEAAAARAAAAAENSGGAPASVDLTLTAPGSGEVRYPLASFTPGEGPGSGRGHQGWDMIAPEGTPIFAAASGVVRVSSEGYWGYGVAIVIDHVIGGQQVSTTYGHMVYGSRLVSEGEYVEAGQVIGQVGNTGNSYGAHLHFEVHINGGMVDPEIWLAANAG
ncbi:M23 family metallopeptidase [Microbacterium sp. YY-01]|uniref:M23 family metallopeptidase n=1 Tax=Microbacterium sp. YY-01 TaxID=3421634 RepID=UPI003D183E80